MAGAGKVLIQQSVLLGMWRCEALRVYLHRIVPEPTQIE